MNNFSKGKWNPIITSPISNYTYENMLHHISLLKKRYPDHIRIDTIAYTSDQRRVAEVLLGSPKADMHVVIQASIHGREHLNTLLVMKQLDDILIKYDTSSYRGVGYRELFEKVCFHILPMTNPDGVTISQKGIRGVRSKKLRQHLYQCCYEDYQMGYTTEKESDYWLHFKANARGVDLNRNFDAGWRQYQSTASPSFQGYKGPAPGSEIETRAILRAAAKSHAACVISYHSAGDLIYWDYGSQGMVYENNKKLASLASCVTGYPMESTQQNQTDAAGCSDYFTLKKGIPAITIENGSGICPLSVTEFPQIWHSNQELWPALAHSFYLMIS